MGGVFSSHQGRGTGMPFYQKIPSDVGAGYAIGYAGGLLVHLVKGLGKSRKFYHKGMFKVMNYVIRKRLKRASRIAARFGKWTFWFGLNNWMLETLRGVDDILNPMLSASIMTLVGRITKKRFSYLLPSRRKVYRTRFFSGNFMRRRFHRKWKKKLLFPMFFLGSLEGAIGLFTWWNAEMSADLVHHRFGDPNIDEEEDLEKIKFDFMVFGEAPQPPDLDEV